MNREEKKILMFYHRFTRFDTMPNDIQIVALDIIREFRCPFNLSTGFASHPKYGCDKIQKVAYHLINER